MCSHMTGRLPPFQTEAVKFVKGGGGSLSSGFVAAFMMSYSGRRSSLTDVPHSVVTDNSFPPGPAEEPPCRRSAQPPASSRPAPLPQPPLQPESGKGSRSLHVQMNLGGLAVPEPELRHCWL